jgi:hypothetical protein
MNSCTIGEQNQYQISKQSQQQNKQEDLMNQGILCLHKGAKASTREELDLIPVPPETETYQPVSHYGLANKLITISRDILTGYTLSKESYGIAREGQQLFGVLQFQNTADDIGLAIGFRNSYDKSMSVGLACGASVFVCDNLAFSGSITIMRKHTKFVWDELEEKAILTCYRAQHNYKEILNDVDKFKALPFSTDEGFSHMGVLYGKDIIGPRQMAVAKTQWLSPKYPDFKPLNAWSLYNAITESLKTSPPQEIMENHIQLHDYFKNFVLNS